MLSRVEEKFTIHLSLKDKSGKIISSNEYLFLIGDQAKATKQFNAMRQSMVEKNGKYSYGNYYRFFDEMTKENGQDYQSDTEHPKAKGFNQKSAEMKKN